MLDITADFEVKTKAKLTPNYQLWEKSKTGFQSCLYTVTLNPISAQNFDWRIFSKIQFLCLEQHQANGFADNLFVLRAISCSTKTVLCYLMIFVLVTEMQGGGRALIFGTSIGPSVVTVSLAPRTTNQISFLFDELWFLHNVFMSRHTISANNC